MALEMLDYHSFAKMERDMDVQEAASAGLEGMQRLISLLSRQHHPQMEECSSIAGTTISEFKKVVSLLGRSGHARFRRGPQSASPSKENGFSETLMESCSSEGAASDSDSGSGNTLFRPQPIAAVAPQVAKQPPSFSPSSLSSDTSNGSPNTAFSPVIASASQNHANSTLPLRQQAKPEMQTLGEFPNFLSNQHRLGANPPQSMFANGIPLNSSTALAQSLLLSSQNKVGNGVLQAPALYRSDGTIFAVAPQQFFFQAPAIVPANGVFEKTVKPQPSLSLVQSTQLMLEAPTRKAELSSSRPPPLSAATTSFMSSLSLDGSVANGNQLALQTTFVHGGSNGRPPVSTIKKKCSGKSEDAGGKCSSSGKCHCSKRRKSKNKVVKMVPAISSKMADIPTDEYSWRKYGQKPIKGSPHPRGYYKCSTVRGCPARKHVERSLENPNMLIVTYEGEHGHPHQPVNEVMQE